jgi:hypothetical protein
VRFDISPAMARYFSRTCPKCRDYFGVIGNQSSQKRKRSIKGSVPCVTTNSRLAGDPHHSCLRCNGYVGIILHKPGRNTPLQAVNGHCLRCPYRMAWIVIRGGRSAAADRLFVAFKHHYELSITFKNLFLFGVGCL